MKPLVRRLSEIALERSICGYRQRLVSAEDAAPASITYLAVSEAERHLHRAATEFYYVIEGEGALELDGEQVALAPGTLVMISPGVAHRATGDVKTLVIGVPPFAPQDQFPA
jgi:mannose-6-phosphate isomerase-like protein (cupin superfamily)